MTQAKIRPLTRDEVKFELLVEMDDQEVDMQSGDPDYKEQDDAEEQKIRERLEQGDYWAWCVVTVLARWGSFSASASVGGCCFADEQNFEEDGIKSEVESMALDRLNDTLESVYASLQARAV